MSTRATIRFAKREEGVSFNEHPHQWNAQFYRHHDGYPEGLGVEIAESFAKYGKLMNWEVESLDLVHGDIEYMYYVWQCHGKTDPWISIFKIGCDDVFCPTCDQEVIGDGTPDECIFVGTPDALLDKFDERRIACENRGYCVNSTQSDMDQGVDPEFCSPRGCGKIQICDEKFDEIHEIPRCNRCECGDMDPNLCGSACIQNTN